MNNALIAFAFATLALAPLTGCSRGPVPLGAPSGSAIAIAQDPELVRAAVARALAERRYTVEGEEPGKISARLDHRGVQLRVLVTYGPTDYRIQYVDSVGLGYMIDPQTGQPVISRNYARYVSQLEREIRDELDRPAREAREAVEQEREQQLALERERTERELAVVREQNEEHERDRRARVDTERARADAAQATAARARAEADAEYARRLPPPRIANHDVVEVSRFRFEPTRMQSQTVALQPGFMPDPWVITGQARGRTPSRQLGIPESCAGFWSNRPEQVVSLPYDFNYLRIDASAEEDVTLAVVTPDGQVFCDDDGAGGTNARLEGAFPAGTYAIYVGTYRAGRSSSYALELSERQGGYAAPPQQPVVYPSAPAQRAPAQRQPPDCRQAVLRAGHSGASLIHCQGAEPYCAEALLQAEHNPAGLIHCGGVDPSCAVTMMQSGRNPAELIHCR